MKLTFTIKSWEAWLPGIRNHADWQAFLSSDRKPGSNEPFTNMDYRYLKPAQRRRLSDISKITLDVAYAIARDNPQVYSVFASRRGEVSRMAGLLQSICRDEELSPTAFSMSVHNTTSGLFSIHTGNRAPSTAIAAGHDTVVAGFIEACSILASGQKQVLLVLSEDQMPAVYQTFACSNEQPVAAAFMLIPGDDFILESAVRNTPADIPGTSDQVSQIISAIITGEPADIAGERMQCQIRRTR
ncbi:beta-ketoacyl synthase chain length factor [Endozoicomonas sp.]|uniref:beta-ketoacyl synthase chain length factor n=1 Tax=Endozoicomonas sp. TaxID=1892382 RepID=UPI002886ED31|nr:beta-ketoacyl synthase chain length factor [Endozoicomonas sp.]